MRLGGREAANMTAKAFVKRTRTKRRRKRRYRLTLRGRRALQANIRRTRPWQKATGPQTPEGKARSSRNALKHGRRSREAIAEQRTTGGFLRMVEGMADLDGADLDYAWQAVKARDSGQPVPAEAKRSWDRQSRTAAVNIVKGCEQQIRHGDRLGWGRKLLAKLDRILAQQGKDGPSLVEQARRTRLVGTDSPARITRIGRRGRSLAETTSETG